MIYLDLICLFLQVRCCHIAQSESTSPDEIMSIRSGFIFLVLLGFISVVTPNSANPISDQPKEIKIKWNSPTLDLQKENNKTRNSSSNADQNPQKESVVFNLPNGHEENNSGLQKRGIGSIFFGTNFGGDSYDIGNFNFGSNNYDFSAKGSQTSSGSYLNMNVQGVQVQVFSPHRAQSVSFKGKKVFVNDKLVCGDTGDLSDKRTYQKGEDASLWHTNLEIGKELTPQEIEEFKRRVKKIEEEMEKAREEARKQREAALAEARRQREEARKQREAALEEGRRQREKAARQRDAALEEGRRQRENAAMQREAALEEGRRQRETVASQREAALEEGRRQREKAARQREAALEEGRKQREEAARQREVALEEGRRQREDARKQREKALAEAKMQREEAQRQREEALAEAKRQREEAQKQREAALDEARKQREEARKQRETALEEARTQREEAQKQREEALEEAKRQREAAAAEASKQREEARKQTENAEKLWRASDSDTVNVRFGDNISSSIFGSGSFSFGDDDYDMIASGSKKPNGFHLMMDGEGVRVQAFSPTNNQKIAFKGKEVFINDKLVCTDSRNLSAERTYQKREDGSKWYTNLKVGTEMTAGEVKDFKRIVGDSGTGSEETEKQREAAQEKAPPQKKSALEEVKKQAKEASNQNDGSRQVAKGAQNARKRNRNGARQTRGAVKRGKNSSNY